MDDFVFSINCNRPHSSFVVKVAAEPVTVTAVLSVVAIFLFIFVSRIPGLL